MHELPSRSLRNPVLAAFVRKSSECLAREARRIPPTAAVRAAVADTLSELTQDARATAIESSHRLRR